MNRTKKLISDAFWQLLEEKPYNKITVQNIVDWCQVNRNTFYYHFSDIPALAEYTIEMWADDIIQANCELGSPISCIMPIVNECIKRKNACLHLYQSVRRESFMRYLNEISEHMVECYFTQAMAGLNISLQTMETLIHYYKCVLFGIILVWFDSGMSYNLGDFCEKICDLFADFGKEVLLKHIKNRP